MCLFTICLAKIIPLYINILLGYLGGKLLNINRDSIARLMFYMINPLVIFNGIIHTKLESDVITLPFITFSIGVVLCISFYWLSRRIWSDSTSNLIAYSAGTGNAGYFGLPLALVFFDEEGEGIYIMALLGLIFYENTVGMYMFSLKKQSVKESILLFLTLPSLYALMGGLIYNLLRLPPDIFNEFMVHIKGAYAVLGMMIIGLGLSGLSNFKIDYKFIGVTFLAKFVMWPLIAVSLVFIDNHFFHLFTHSIYNALLLISMVPMAVNTVILASLMNIQQERPAAAVLLGTTLAIIYVPFMAEYLMF